MNIHSSQGEKGQSVIWILNWGDILYFQISQMWAKVFICSNKLEKLKQRGIVHEQIIFFTSLNLNIFFRTWPSCLPKSEVAKLMSTGQIHPTPYILYGLWAKYGFQIFKWLKKTKRIIIFHDMWKLYEMQISTSINKVELERSHLLMPVTAFTHNGRVQ